MLKLFLFLFSTFLFYGKTGHFLIAKIAYKIIKEKNPILLNKIEKDLIEFSKYTGIKNYPFVESAVWADDIKFNGFEAFNIWHYSNRPYFKDKNISTKSKIQNEFKYNQVNIMWAIKQTLITISNKKLSPKKLIYGKSFMLKYLIHLVGDLHQPLHNMNLISKKFPNGNVGGNLNKVKINNKIQNLHHVWDSIMFKYKYVKNPFKLKNYKYIEKISNLLMKKYPKSSFKKDFLKEDIKGWSKENYDLAVKYSYKGIKEKKELTKKYINKSAKILEKCIVKGGYRLAFLLMKYYKFKSNKISIKLIEK